MRRLSRLFIVDPVCVLPYGHNAVSVKEYHRRFAKYFRSVIPLLSKETPNPESFPTETRFPFRYYYDSQMRVRPFSGVFDTVSRRDMPKFSRFLRRCANRVGISMISDPLRAKAVRDWVNVFKVYDIGPSDIIFFPSGDYYSMRGLLRILENSESSVLPAIHLNLINVMEDGCRNRDNGYLDVLREIVKLGHPSERFIVTAETPAYASILADKLMVNVDYIPFPPVGERMEIYKKEQFHVGIIGAARGDKGYFRLHNIISETNRRVGKKKLVFAAQRMSKENREYCEDYESRLSRLDNLVILSDSLSDDKIKKQYQESDIILMPYCNETYRLRGSAVMSESMAYGRILITSKSCAFSGIVEECEMGKTCNSDEEFANALIEFSKFDRNDLVSQSDRAQRNFLSLYRAKFELILKRLLDAIEGEGSI